MLERTGYKITVTTGQRKYGGPPPASVDIGKHGAGECFIGSINRDAFEPEIVPLLETIPDATIYEIRLMMGYDGKVLIIIQLPSFLSKEITGIKKFSNYQLSSSPFSEWENQT